MAHERLYEAARSNNVRMLDEILRTNPLILFPENVEPSTNPLHVAALLGHKEFAKVLMDQNPGLSRERNDKGFYPIHLASSKGHLDFVSDLLESDPRNGQCFLKDLEGRTPLQLAAIKEHVAVVEVLLTRCVESAKEVTLKKETVLHLVVNYNLCEVMESLLSLLGRHNNIVDELVNFKDEDGNTVLHIAAARKQVQMLKILSRNTNVSLNEVNGSGLTALEASVMDFKESNDKSSDKAGKKNRASDIKNLLNGILILNSLFATISFDALINLSDDTPKKTMPPAATAPPPDGHVHPSSVLYTYMGGALCFFSSLVTILVALTLSTWKKLWSEFYALVPVMTACTVLTAGNLFVEVFTLQKAKIDQEELGSSAIYAWPAFLTICFLFLLLLGRGLVRYRERH